MTETKPDSTGFITKDSGTRDEFKTGALRDTLLGKGRADRLPWEWIELLSKSLEGPFGDDVNVIEGLKLLPIRPLLRLAALYGRGKIKYGADNWLKGMPLSRIFASMANHLIKWAKGEGDEDHLAAVAWNAFALMEIGTLAIEDKLPKELLNFGPDKVK